MCTWLKTNVYLIFFFLMVISTTLHYTDNYVSDKDVHVCPSKGMFPRTFEVLTFYTKSLLKC